MSNETKQRNPQYTIWLAQVQANYHDGGMTAEDAEKLAGPEPEKYITKEKVQ